MFNCNIIIQLIDQLFYYLQYFSEDQIIFDIRIRIPNHKSLLNRCCQREVFMQNHLKILKICQIHSGLCIMLIYVGGKSLDVILSQIKVFRKKSLLNIFTSGWWGVNMSANLRNVHRKNERKNRKKIRGTKITPNF